MVDERRGAVTLAAVAAGLIVVTWSIGWWSTPADVRSDAGLSTPIALLVPMAVAGVLLLAAWLVSRGRTVEGAVGLATAAVLLLPDLVLLLPRELLRATFDVWLGVLVLTVLGQFAVVAGALLLRGHLDWAELRGSGTRVGVLVAGVAAVLGRVFPTIVHRPPQVPVSTTSDLWRPIATTTGDVLHAGSFVLYPLALLAVLFLASRMRGRYAAMVVATAVVPLLAGDLGSLGTVYGRPDLQLSPVAWVSLTGQATLLAMALRWATRPRGGPVSSASGPRRPTAAARR